MSEHDFKEKLREFILYKLPSKNSSNQEMPDLDFSTELFETGFVSSLGIVQLISFVEGETGQKISLREVTITHFRSIDAIAAKFCNKSEK